MVETFTLIMEGGKVELQVGAIDRVLVLRLADG